MLEYSIIKIIENYPNYVIKYEDEINEFSRLSAENCRRYI